MKTEYNRKYYKAHKKQIQERNRLWYLAHREQYNKRIAERRQERLEYIRQAKDKPCYDCGMLYPHYVMDFDHLGIVGKYKSIAKMGSNSLENIKAEIDKCEVVCSNCHRKRTYERGYSQLKFATTIG